MAPITEAVLRKRAEHNEGCLSTLKEVGARLQWGSGRAGVASLLSRPCHGRQGGVRDRVCAPLCPNRRLCPVGEAGGRN